MNTWIAIAALLVAPLESQWTKVGKAIEDRDPLGVEQDACIDWLRRQTALLRPKIIVCLGRIAAKVIIKDDFRITQEHGQWFERSGVWMTALYHPAALLRDVRKRPETFEDLKAIQAKARELCEHTEL